MCDAFKGRLGRCRITTTNTSWDSFGFFGETELALGLLQPLVIRPFNLFSCRFVHLTGTVAGNL